MNTALPIPASFDPGLANTSLATTGLSTAGLAKAESSAADDSETKQKFQEILGELLFAQMLKSMRKTVGEPAYFHGGRAEEMFTQQLDQVLAEKISQTTGDQFFGPMYACWSAGRR